MFRSDRGSPALRVNQTDRKEWILKRLGWASAVFILLVGVFYLVENARGERARSSAKAGLAAAGESVDLRRFLVPTVFPAENFCATPALLRFEREWTDSATASSPLKFLDRFDRRPRFQTLQDRKPIDWEAFRAAAPKEFPLLTAAEEPDAAKAVARHFVSQEAFFAELAAAARTRPHAQFSPPLYSHDGRSGIIWGLRRAEPFSVLFDAVEMKARAALATGSPDEALGMLRVLWKFRQAMAVEPYRSAGFFSRLRLDEQASRVVLDGLRAHSWDDRQLLEIQEELAGRNLHREALEMVRWELADAWDFVDRLTGPNSAAFQELTGGLETPGLKWIVRLAPRGWRHQTQALAAYESMDGRILPLRAHGMLAWYRAESERGARQESGTQLPRYCRLLLPTHWGARDWLARMVLFREIEARQLRLACALERHRLRHREYPGSLSRLDATFLSAIPLDVDAQPMRYAFDPASGQYRVWSVGVDGVDNWQGKPPVAPPVDPRAKSSRRLRTPRPEEALDWVLEAPWNLVCGTPCVGVPAACAGTGWVSGVRVCGRCMRTGGAAGWFRPHGDPGGSGTPSGVPPGWEARSVGRRPNMA